MNLFTRTLSKIFKSSNQQELDKIQNLIQSINSKEKDLESLGEEKTIQELVNDIEKRDQYDSLREISPLRKAEDAVEVDTSQMTIDDQVSRIIEIVNQKQ